MTAPTFSTLGFANGFVPRATNELIAFVRDESEWAMNRYLQYVPAPLPGYRFWQMGRDEPIRNEAGVVAPTALGGGPGSALKAWMPGDPVPYGNWNKWPGVWQEGKCEYRLEPWIVAHDEIKTNEVFEPKLAYTKMVVSKLLTDRVNRIAGTACNASNWGTHANSVNAINGGRGPWSTGSDDPSSPNYNAILITLQNVALQISLDTNGVVGADKINFVLSPQLAIKMAQTSELCNYCRQSNVALQLLEKGFDPQWERYGLPTNYKGFTFVVEDAPIVTANQTLPSAGNGFPNQPVMATESSTRQFIWPSGTVVAMSRVGGLDGEFGSKSFSTMQMYHYEGLLRQYAFDEPEHHRVIGHVMECVDFRIVASISGYCITNAM